MSKKKNNKKEKNEPVSLGIGSDGFVPVSEDHWFSDILKNSNLDKYAVYGVITLDGEKKEPIK